MAGTTSLQFFFFCIPVYYTCLPNILVSRVSALFKSIIRLHGRVTLGVTPANLTQAVVGHPGVLAEGSHVFPSGN